MTNGGNALARIAISSRPRSALPLERSMHMKRKKVGDAAVAERARLDPLVNVQIGLRVALDDTDGPVGEHRHIPPHDDAVRKRRVRAACKIDHLSPERQLTATDGSAADGVNVAPA